MSMTYPDLSANNYARTLDIMSIGAQEGSVGGGEIRFVTNPNNSSTGLSRMIINNRGYVGIGIDNPTYILQVNGQPAANGYTAWTNYSDSRLKENIHNMFPIGESIMEKMRLLRPVSFTYNGLGGYTVDDREVSGFIAQELMQIFPEMVNMNNATGYYDTNLSNLSLYLVQGLKEVDSEVELLKERVVELEEIIASGNDNGNGNKK